MNQFRQLMRNYQLLPLKLRAKRHWTAAFPDCSCFVCCHFVLVAPRRVFLVAWCLLEAKFCLLSPFFLVRWLSFFLSCRQSKVTALATEQKTSVADKRASCVLSRTCVKMNHYQLLPRKPIANKQGGPESSSAPIERSIVALSRR